MKISVIIPTYRRPESLSRCLAALSRQTRRPDDVLVVVREDDRATDDVLALYEDSPLPLRVLEADGVDASVARNRCVAAASGDLLAFTDDDTEPHPDWLARIEENFETDLSLGALGGPDWLEGDVVPAEQRASVVGKIQWWGRRVGNHHRGTRAPREVEWLKGANMSFRRAALRAIPFGQDLRGKAAQFGEDLTASLEIKRAGWTVKYDPAVAVNHFPGDVTEGADHRSLQDRASLLDAGHNETVALLRYLPPLRRAAFLPWALLIGTRRMPGILMAFYLLLTRGSLGAFRRSAFLLAGRWNGIMTWRRTRVEQLAIRQDRRNGPASTARPAEVCLVTHVVTPWDGQGRVNYELARYLLRRGHRVTLVASSVERTLRDAAGVTWIRIPVPTWLPAIVQWTVFALLARMRLGWGPRRFDVVHLNGAITPFRADVNTSHFVHASWRRLDPRGVGIGRVPVYQRMVTAISAYCERRAYASAARVVAVSYVVREALLRDAGVAAAGTRVIYNGVDTEEFRPRRPQSPPVLRSTLALASDAIVVLFVGDAKSPRKNLDLVLRAMPRLDPRYHLVVIGPERGGPYPAMAAELGVASRAHFLGPRRDMADFYRDADVVFCASHYEPSSLVLLEAMASGLPVVTASGVGNAPFVLEGTNGYVLESTDDLDRLVDVLTGLADVELRQRIGRAARNSALALSWEQMGRQYEELYLELLEERSRVRRRRQAGAAELTSMEQRA